MLIRKMYTTVVQSILLIVATVFFSQIGSAQENSLQNLEAGLNDLVYDISRSIVTVEASEPIYPNNYTGRTNEAIYSIISTGLIYDSSGHVLVLASSIANHSQIKIRIDDKIIPAKLIAVDYQNGVALLKMPKLFGSPILIREHTGCAGQMVLAVGNSYGVRAAPSIGFCAGFRPDGLMQFQASYSTSSNGGGLFTLSGQLIGIITGSVGDQNDIGLAFPAHKLHEIVKYLIKNGDRLAGYIGLSTTIIGISPPIEVLISNRMTSSSSSQRLIIDGGLVISKVIPNSPAARAGLRHGDLIFQANGRKIEEAFELANYVKKSSPGTKINFDILRQQSAYSIQLTIGQMKLASSENNPSASSDDLLTDSILKEIQFLRESIDLLENSVNRLR